MTAAQSARPWLDPDRSTNERVDLLLAQMTLAEKVGQTQQVANIHPDDDATALAQGRIGSSLFASGATGGNERDEGVLAANIDAAQRHAVQESRLGIPVLFGRDVIHGPRTVCPIPLGLAASFDEDLVEAVAALAASEAVVDGVAWSFAPMVDLSEEPRWGRVAESLGETPVLSGRLAAAMVRGFQGTDPSDPDRIAACAKHFAGYGLSAGGRDYDTVSVGENTLRNLHLRPFKAAVDAGVATVMAAFNDVDGVPMHAHRHLLRDVLKGEWGFDGVVVADWNGIGQLVHQGVAADLRDAARQAIEAGVDLDMCSGSYAAHLAQLVEAGEVDEALVDDAVRRLLTLKFRLGLFDRPYVGDPGRGNAPTAQSREVARRAAHASHVLVSNNGVLPLASDAGTVHLTGPFAEAAGAHRRPGTLDGRGGGVVSPASAFRARLGEQRLLVSDGRFSDRAVQQVRNADVTVAVVGEHPWRSGEANSVPDIGLPAGQREHLRQLARIGKPRVVVAYTGRPLELGDVMDLADAVLVVWHPGVEAGNALADIVFGDVAPHGRLPMTFPRTTGHIPTSTHQRPTGRLIELHEEGRQGRYLDDQVFPRLPFGHGLTYTSFEYGELRAVGGTALSGGAGLAVEVDVTNTGDRPGREVVQLSFRDPVAQVTRPLTELVDWSVLDLQPGEKGTATFTVHPEQFSYFGRDNSLRLDAGEIVLVAGPDALHGPRLSVTVTP